MQICTCHFSLITAHPCVDRTSPLLASCNCWERKYTLAESNKAKYDPRSICTDTHTHAHACRTARYARRSTNPHVSDTGTASNVCLTYELSAARSLTSDMSVKLCAPIHTHILRTTVLAERAWQQASTDRVQLISAPRRRMLSVASASALPSCLSFMFLVWRRGGRRRCMMSSIGTDTQRG